MSKQTTQTTPPSTGPPGPIETARRMRRQLLGGDRPYIVAFVAALGFSTVVVSGPIQTWLGQRQLVEERQAVLEALEEENGQLSDRVEDLNDPATIEGEAREEQGMVRPGEVPYGIVPPPMDAEQIAPDLSDAELEQRGWFGRVWEAVTGFFS